MNQFKLAAKCASAVSWIMNLKSIYAPNEITEADEDLVLVRAVENVYSELVSLPVRGKRYEERIKDFEVLINSDKENKFKRGLETLGRLLGFYAERPNNQGDPDSVWLFPGYINFVIEAKSEQKDVAGVTKRDLQQTKGHIEWLLSEKPKIRVENIRAILITPRKKISSVATRFTEDVFILNPKEIRLVAVQVVSMYRKVGALASSDYPEKVRSSIKEEMLKKKITPTDIKKLLLSLPVSKLEVY